MRISDWSSDVCSSDLSYATQLLEESTNLDDGDHRLLQIVHQQCMRTNGIVESVLGLARRERAQPENIDLVVFVRRFLDDYLETIPPDLDDIKFSHGVPTLPVLVDPRHLQQVRSEEHTSELQSLMRISYAVFCL